MTHRTKQVKVGELALEKKLKKVMRRLAAQAHDAALKALASLDKAAKSPAEAAAEAIWGDVDWTLLINPTEEQLALVAQDGAKRALLALGVTDEGITEQVFEEARDWARDRAAEMVGKRYDAEGELVDSPDADMSITDTARDEIRSAVARGIDDGASAQDVADEIADLGTFSDERALTISRTEIIRANNQGHLASFKEAGIEQKEWSTAEDGDVCPECEANEDEGPIGVDDDFPSGDDAAPAHPNCRCTIVAVVPDESSDEEDSSDGEDDVGEGSGTDDGS